MPDDKRKLCVWVPDDLYKNVVKAGYNGPTDAVTKGFKLLTLFDKHDLEEKLVEMFETRDDIHDSGDLLRAYISEFPAEPNVIAINKELKEEVERLTEALQKAPDPVELAELRANLSGLQRLLEEKDKRIEDLTKAVDMFSVFMDYFKTLNQNK